MAFRESYLRSPSKMDDLSIPDDKAMAKLTFFAAEEWERLSKIIKDYLASKHIMCSVAKMVKVVNEDEEEYKPYIIIRVVPSSLKGITTTTLSDEIQEVIFSNGYLDPAYEVHVEARRAGPPPDIKPPVLNSGWTVRHDLERYEDDEDSPSKTTSTIVPSPADGSPLAKLAGVGDIVKNGFTGAINNGATITAGPTGPVGATGAGDGTINTAYGATRAVQAGGYRSVKHLTCWYWLNKGCTKSEEQCLYSHFDTGRYADQPRALFPGGRAVAGRNAERTAAIIQGHPQPQDQMFHPAIMNPNAAMVHAPPIWPIPPQIMVPAPSSMATIPELYSAFKPAKGAAPILASPLPNNLAFTPPSDEGIVERRGTTATSQLSGLSSLQILNQKLQAASLGQAQKTTTPINFPNASLSSSTHPLHDPHRREYNGLDTLRRQASTRSFAAPESAKKTKNHAIPIKAPTDKSAAVNTSAPPSFAAGPTSAAKSSKKPIKLSVDANTDKMKLIYSNMHFAMGARELCIGLDSSVSTFTSLASTLSHLTATLSSTTTIKNKDNKDTAKLLTDLKSGMEGMQKSIKSAISDAEERRGRAQDMIKQLENGPHVFEKRDDADVDGEESVYGGETGDEDDSGEDDGGGVVV